MNWMDGWMEGGMDDALYDTTPFFPCETERTHKRTNEERSANCRSIPIFPSRDVESYRVTKRNKRTNKRTYERKNSFITNREREIQRERKKDVNVHS